MHEEPEFHSRPPTPQSPLTSSLRHATATIDDLTLALANFSRVPSPEPPSLLSCCCGADDCEHFQVWLAYKSKLENRLILSAEVGQALLQRHEAYVRRHEQWNAQGAPVEREASTVTDDFVDTQLAELLKEKTALEKSLTRALVNNEVSEVSNKTVLHELQEARITISKLTAHHARSVGLETRVDALSKENEDLRQERDGEARKARFAESRITALQGRTSKLQKEINRLQLDLEQRRLHRLESSESLLQDARARLESLQNARLNHNMTEDSEVTKVLESLVEDNEALKRDNAELQTLLADSREDLHMLQEEVDEQRAHPPFRADAGTPNPKHVFYTGSVPSSSVKDRSIYHSNGRAVSSERQSRHPFELLTPETTRRPLSPTASLTPSETKWTSFGQPQPRYPPQHFEFEVDDESRDNAPSSPEAFRSHKPLFLLTRSRGVQTERWNLSAAPSPSHFHMSTLSPYDPRSESSSFSDSQPSHFSAIIERVVMLFNRMAQADALTLTNRLKRQHLRGADVGHLSRSTVSSILSDASGLRVQFRALLEDDKATTTCTRKDLRGLFKLFRDIFTEMGEMRVILNDIILEPTAAVKISERALDPSKGENSRESERSNASPGWMAPISKLFGAQSGSGEMGRVARPGNSGLSALRPPPRVIPKLGPALAASATTVNVEFSGTGVGRSVSSTIAGQPSREGQVALEVPTSSQETSTRVMGIFAGAPRSSTPDPWVVLPKGPRRMQSALLRPDTAGPPRRSALTGNPNRLSRNVDAVIDVDSPQDDNDEEPDYLAPLLERTLRRRGLSDSSIHSTFMAQAQDSRPSNSAVQGPFPPGSQRVSVLQTLSRKVQSFASNTFSSAQSEAGTSPPQSSHAPVRPPAAESDSGLHSFAALLPSMTSWVSSEPFYVGSSPNEPLLHRTREDEHHSRDFL